MMDQTTLLIIKPDAVRNRKVGKIIQEIEDLGFEVVETSVYKFSRNSATRFYNEHLGKDFFQKHVDFISSGDCIALVISGEDVINRLRLLAGSTNPAEAEVGTLRQKYGTGLPENAVHTSDSEESFQREVEIIFPELYY